jgi:DUF971 family protein
MDVILPEEISAEKNTKELTVVWADGHTSVYPFALLRHACPCEQCRDGSGGNVPVSAVFYMPLEDTAATRLVEIDRVGAYGITIEWEDGHQFGIYSWQYLRALCPCPICREMMIYGQ